MRTCAVILVFLLTGLFCKSAGAVAATNSFVGSKSCRDCHEGFYQKWATSHHGLAMQPFTEAFARAQLIPMTNQVVVGGQRYRADLAKLPAVVRETGQSGEKQYRIEHVLGGKNVFYFLALLDKGRL